MKKCPQCGQTYEDESLFFCLSDGASLTSIPDPEATRLSAPPQIPNTCAIPYYSPQPPARGRANPLLIGLVILLLLMLGGSAAAFILYQWTKEKPVVNQEIKRGTPEPSRTLSINSSATPELKSSPSITTELHGTPKALPSVSVVVEGNEQYFRIIQTSDGFTSVRAAPTTKSAEKGRLFPGTRISCESTVKGERVSGTDSWHYCPSVGGYVYSKLLVTAP